MPRLHQFPTLLVCIERCLGPPWLRSLLRSTEARTWELAQGFIPSASLSINVLEEEQAAEVSILSWYNVRLALRYRHHQFRLYASPRHEFYTSAVLACI
jgi:hypothetical protein